MKKYEQQLQKLASKFQSKYAQSQNLQDIILNAASYGETSANGIMNFLQQLKRDQADMYITVVISSGMMGGRSAEVYPPKLDPVEVAGKYAKLPEQIKNYLNKHLSSFPQIPEGTSTLTFSGKSEGGIAQL